MMLETRRQQQRLTQIRHRIGILNAKPEIPELLTKHCTNGTFVISHIFRGQWSALEREQKIRLYCDADNARQVGVINNALKQEAARRAAVVKNMQRLRALRLPAGPRGRGTRGSREFRGP
jgi:hypothetical protein